MGNSSSSSLPRPPRLGKPKTKTKRGKKVKAQKIDIANKTGILSLQDLKLKQIPPDTFQLNKLKTLDCSGNNIISYPEEIQNLTMLKSLKFDRNNLTSLPHLEGLTRLTTLSVAGNRLDDESHCALPQSLQQLCLAQNALTRIPTGLALLGQVQTLDLSGCQFTRFPHPMVGMGSLSELILDDNAIETISSDIIHFLSLEILSLKRNRFRARTAAGQQSIAKEVFSETDIKRLHLDGNPLTQGELLGMEGFDVFLERRKKLKQKELHGGLTNFSLCGLD
mmetsp:Transcript_42014/g.72373  ORF Transcript_42014/g.72373 Transcript_42014/m.72373 type:complete len:279 (+) Transcript_42014:49-885(+)